MNFKGKTKTECVHILNNENFLNLFFNLILKTLGYDEFSAFNFSIDYEESAEIIYNAICEINSDIEKIKSYREMYNSLICKNHYLPQYDIEQCERLHIIDKYINSYNFNEKLQSIIPDKAPEAKRKTKILKDINNYNKIGA